LLNTFVSDGEERQLLDLERSRRRVDDESDSHASFKLVCISATATRSVIT
jgi:hypothetical protein